MSVSPHYFVFLENPSRALAGGGEIFTGQVHLKVNRSYSSDSGLLIEPAISGTTMLQRLSLARHVMLSGLISKRCQRSNSRNEMCACGRPSCRAIGALSLAGPRFMSANMSDFRS
jgi:hypothetical protein